MIDSQTRPASYFKLMALVVVLGVISALITFAFIALVQVGTQRLWEDAAQTLGLDVRLFTILVCTAGGLLVGLLVKLFGDHNGIFADLMTEFGKTGRFDYRNAPGIVITAFVSLISGASLGPEAPLADACGGIGTLVSDKLKLDQKETRTMGFSGVSSMLGAFITSPFAGALLGLELAQGGGGGLLTYFWVLFPSLLGSAVATTVFVMLSGQFFETLYTFPSYSPRLVDLLYAVPLGLLGGVIGLVFMLLLRRLQRLFEVMKGRVVLRALIGGLAMGIIGALLPLTLVCGRDANSRPDRPCGGDRRRHAGRPGNRQTVRHDAFARHRLERRLYLPHHVRQRRLGLGGEPFVPRYSRRSCRRGDDGGRACRFSEGASVRGALHDGAGAEGNRARDGGRHRSQRLAAGVSRTAPGDPRRKAGAASCNDWRFTDH